MGAVGRFYNTAALIGLRIKCSKLLQNLTCQCGIAWPFPVERHKPIAQCGLLFRIHPRRDVELNAPMRGHAISYELQGGPIFRIGE